MSLITFDYECKSCAVVEERRVERSEAEKQYCNECSGLMAKLFPNMAFRGIVR